MSLGKCPVCGGDVIKFKSGNYGCIDGVKNEDFHFLLYHSFRRFQDTIELDDKKVRALLNKETINETLTSKEGEKYNADLEMKIVDKGDKHYVNLVPVKG